MSNKRTVFETLDKKIKEFEESDLSNSENKKILNILREQKEKLEASDTRMRQEDKDQFSGTPRATGPTG